MATIQPVEPVATCRQTVEALLAQSHRLAADGYDSARSHLSPVATCRQTVEAFLATPTTAWQPMATIQPVATVARSHLSPDGGSLPRHAYHRLAADGYDSARSHRRP